MTATPLLLYNDELLPEAGFALPLPNRGLFYNDGCFETLVLTARQWRFLPYHVARLEAAALALGLALPPALRGATALAATLERLPPPTPDNPDSRFRLQIWRSGGGLYTPDSEAGAVAWLATRHPFRLPSPVIARLEVATSARTQFSAVSFCKGPNALVYVLTARERQQRGLDELVLLSAAGHVAETTSAAIFWRKDGQLYTPALSTGCVAGVHRAWLLAQAAAAGRPVLEVEALPEALAAADAAWAVNVAGIRVIKAFEDQPLAQTGPLVV